MSLGDVSRILNRLYAEGLIPGDDCAVADMHHGALFPCHGIRVSELRGEDRVFPAWVAEMDPSYRCEPEDMAFSWWPPEPPAAPAPPKEPGSKRPPTHVVFGTGPVHWLYHDDDGDEWD